MITFIAEWMVHMFTSEQYGVANIAIVLEWVASSAL